MSHSLMPKNTKSSTPSSSLEQLGRIVRKIENGDVPEITPEMSANLEAALESNKVRDPIKQWAEKLSKSSF